MTSFFIIHLNAHPCSFLVNNDYRLHHHYYLFGVFYPNNVTNCCDVDFFRTVSPRCAQTDHATGHARLIEMFRKQMSGLV